MKSVQLENGYTRLANELLEAITISRFNATQLKIILCVIRRTYGFQKKESELSITFISRATGISKRYVAQEINHLISSKILIVSKEYTMKSSRRLKLNKNYIEWETYRGIVPQVSNSSTDEELFHSPVEVDFHRPIEADFHQKRKKETYKEMAIDLPSSSASTRKPYEDYFVKVWEAYHNKKGKNKVTSKQKLKLYNEVPEEQMLRAIEKYKKETKETESRYIMHGSTWFNGGYEDYIEPVKAPPGPKKELVYGSYEEKMHQMVEEGLQKMKAKPKIKIKPYEEKLKELEEAELRRLTHGNDQGV